MKENTHTMTLRTFVIVAVFAALVGMAPPVFAQTLLTNTTLSAAMNGTQNTISLTATTGLAVGDQIFIPGAPGFNGQAGQFEIVQVTSLTPQIGVIRGAGGSAGPHRNALAVLFGGPGGRRFYFGPPNVTSNCRRSDETFLPHVDRTSGIVWTCPYYGVLTTVGVWAGSSIALISFNSGPPLTERLPAEERLTVWGQLARLEVFRW